MTYSKRIISIGEWLAKYYVAIKYLKLILDIGIKEIHDSRISNLKVIKSLDPNVQTVYIKPPPKKSIKSLVKFADVSLNTEYETIKLISEEAQTTE